MLENLLGWNQLGGEDVVYITIIIKTKPKPLYYVNHVSFGELKESLRTCPRT